jgi:SOS-response transcriptional repressor LexA
MSLSPQQHRLLTFVAERLRTTGVCPSTSDMMAALGSRGRGNVHKMVTILEQRGYLRRLFHRRSRCIEVLRLPDDMAEHWLRAASTGSIMRELMRRGIGSREQPDTVRRPRRGAASPDTGAMADAAGPPMSSARRRRAAPMAPAESAPAQSTDASSARRRRAGSAVARSAPFAMASSVDMGASHSFGAATATARRPGAAR